MGAFPRRESRVDALIPSLCTTEDMRIVGPAKSSAALR
ncbi:hypothetical protein LF41_653 [Lysobacter dokdonensis DS-58]|uniref:Uncharacterized protein n=1 Tax=Lysobacter dokdonensis DS-58 TaxID=1300345 RepID=A0A0A2X084_9GAMM|nr:hypothetical protein LF41_653 [Lysobacter dokdonensis DS-58]